MKRSAKRAPAALPQPAKSHSSDRPTPQRDTHKHSSLMARLQMACTFSRRDSNCND